MNLLQSEMLRKFLTVEQSIRLEEYDISSIVYKCQQCGRVLTEYEAKYQYCNVCHWQDDNYE